MNLCADVAIDANGTLVVAGDWVRTGGNIYQVQQVSYDKTSQSGFVRGNEMPWTHESMCVRVSLS